MRAPRAPPPSARCQHASVSVRDRPRWQRCVAVRAAPRAADSTRGVISEEWQDLASGSQTNSARRRQNVLSDEAVQIYLDASRGLCACSDTQLAAVEPRLPVDILAAVHVARKISPRNRARKRQEKLVCKMLRDEARGLDIDGLAADLAGVTGQGGSRPDQAAIDLALSWRKQLLSGQIVELESELVGIAVASGAEVSQLTGAIRAARSEAHPAGDEESTRLPQRAGASAKRLLAKLQPLAKAYLE